MLQTKCTAMLCRRAHPPYTHTHTPEVWCKNTLNSTAPLCTRVPGSRAFRVFQCIRYAASTAWIRPLSTQWRQRAISYVASTVTYGNQYTKKKERTQLITTWYVLRNSRIYSWRVFFSSPIVFISSVSSHRIEILFNICSVFLILRCVCYENHLTHKVGTRHLHARDGSVNRARLMRAPPGTCWGINPQHINRWPTFQNLSLRFIPLIISHGQHRRRKLLTIQQ